MVGRGDHLTLVFGEGKETNVHRTVDAKQTWRYSLDSIMASVGTFVRENARQAEAEDFESPDVTLVSLRRFFTLTTFLIIPITMLFSLIWWAFRLGPSLMKRLHSKNGLTLDFEWMRHQTSVLERCLSPLVRLLRSTPPSVWKAVMLRLGRLLTVKPTALKKGDELILALSKTDLGLVWRTDNGLSYLSLQPVLTSIDEIARMLLFSAETLGKIGPGSEFVVTARWSGTPRHTDSKTRPEANPKS